MSDEGAEHTSSGIAAWLTPGVRDMLVAALFFSLMGVLVKFAGERLPSQEIVFARSLVAFILTAWMLYRAGIPAFGHNRRLLLARGVLGFLGLSCFFFAITRLSFADAMVIQFTNPVFATLLAGVWLGEALRVRELLGAFCSLVGVALIARPQFLFGAQAEAPDALALAAALAGALISATVYVIIRKLKESDHALVIVFYFPLIGLPLSIPTMAPDALMPRGWEWLLLLGVGICVQIAQVFMTRGLHKETTSRATTVSYVQVVLAFIWGMLFFDEIPHWTSLAGAALVIFGVLVVTLKPPPTAREDVATEQES